MTVTFQDTGVGFDQTVSAKIGDPFFTTKGNGMGIGFSISKSIAEKHHGELSIENSVDGGAVVTLRLPKEAFK